MSIRSFSRRAFLFGALAAAASGSLAAYPDKPVKLVVAYTPGGATDIIARVLATNLTAKWGQTVVVENKPGASGMMGAEQVVRANPDGYTLLLGYTPEVSINKLLFKSMRYDPSADLTPITLAASAPLVLVAGPKLPVNSLQELLARKGSKETLGYGSPGAGGQQHMAGELLAKLTGLPLMHVPYKGTAPAVSDLLGGHIDIFFATTPPLLPHIKAGKLRPLAVAGDKREALLPNVPTFAELGLPRMQLSNWFGVFAPAGMPAATIAKIANDVAEVLEDPKVVKALEDQGLTRSSLKGADFRQFIDVEMKKYKAIIDETGVTVQ